MAEVIVAAGQVVHASERVGVVRAEMLRVERDRSSKLIGPSLRIAKMIKRRSQRYPQPGFGQWLVGETLRHGRQGGFNGLPQRDLPSQAKRLVLRPGRRDHLFLN